jgi:hypothetical protein
MPLCGTLTKKRRDPRLICCKKGFDFSEDSNIIADILG